MTSPMRPINVLLFVEGNHYIAQCLEYDVGAQGKSIEEVSRHLEITESTWHRWRNQYGGMKADDAKKLRELEKEQRLKRIVADQTLDIDMLKELNRGNF